MIRSAYLSAAALAAALCTPALAQFTDSAATSTTAKPSAAVESPSTTVAKSNAATGKPLCSELNHPKAGKLADRTTGNAKENSASPVHQDCIPDTQPGAATGSMPSNNAPAASATVNPGASAVTGSTAGTTTAGTAADVNTSVTGSTSTITPDIDLRGRSSVTIDSATSTGNPSASGSATQTSKSGR
jgi:hypothetical protein